MRPNPCWTNGKDCPNRHAECHATCEKALKWEAEQEEIRLRRGRDMTASNGVSECHQRRFDAVMNRGAKVRRD